MRHVFTAKSFPKAIALANDFQEWHNAEDFIALHIELICKNEKEEKWEIELILKIPGNK